MSAARDGDEFQQSNVEIIVASKPLHPSCTSDLVRELRQQQRAGLFYDETVRLLVVVDSTLSIEALSTCLAASQLSVSGHLVAFPTQHGSNLATAEETPLKLVLNSTEGTAGVPLMIEQVSAKTSVAVLQAELHLPFPDHPERPLRRPQISFAATLTLGPRKLAAVDPAADVYLASGVPASANLLLPLLSAPDLSRSSVRLPVSRLEKILPTSVGQNDARPVRGWSSAFPIGPAILLKISRTLFGDGVYFTVTLEMAESASFNVELGTVEAQVNGTQATALANTPLPALMTAGDRTSYILRADMVHGASAALFTIDAAVKDQTNGPIKLLIRRSMAGPQNVKTPTRDRVKYWNNSRGPPQPMLMTMHPGPTKDLRTEAFRQAFIVTISAPHTVGVDEIFKLTFLITNKSSRRRRLAILSPPTNSVASPVVMPDRHRSSWERDGPRGGGKVDVAAAVLDSKDVFAQSTGVIGVEGRLARYRATSIPIDTEMKLGMVQQGASHEATMRMRAVNAGLITIEGFLVLDLDSKESCTVGEGWEGIAVEAAGA